MAGVKEISAISTLRNGSCMDVTLAKADCHLHTLTWGREWFTAAMGLANDVQRYPLSAFLSADWINMGYDGCSDIVTHPLDL